MDLDQVVTDSFRLPVKLIELLFDIAGAIGHMVCYWFTLLVTIEKLTVQRSPVHSLPLSVHHNINHSTHTATSDRVTPNGERFVKGEKKSEANFSRCVALMPVDSTSNITQGF